MLGRARKEESGIFTGRDLKKLIWPLIVEQFLAITIGMLDTIMVSSCGEAAVSGVSLVDSINVLLINIFSALATGGAIVAAQYLGKEDGQQANAAAKQLMLSVGVLACVLMLVAISFNRGLLQLLFGAAKEDVMENAVVYFFWTALSYPFIGIYNGGAALYRSMGNSRISMVISLIMNTINVCGNAILIYGFQMGVAGAAIATLVSRMVGAAIVTFLLSNPNHNKIYLVFRSIKDFGFDFSMIRRILGIGIPNGLESGMFQFGKILLQSLVTSFGTVAVAANAVSGNISSLTQIPSIAIGLAMITVVGQCVGAGEYKQAKGYIWKLFGLSEICMIVLCVLLLVFARPVVGIYNLTPETTEVAIELVTWFCCASVLFWPGSYTLPNGLRAASDVRFPMMVSILSMWLCRILCSYLFANTFGLGVLGVWIGMFIDWIFRMAAFVARMLSGKWMGKKSV